MKSLLIFVAMIAAVAAVQKCCPQPENQGKCDCCPDACCCMCENITIPATPEPTRPATTSTVCEIGDLDVALIVDSSLSVRSFGWDIAMQFLSDLVSEPAWAPVGGTGTRFGFIKYNDYATTVWSIMDPQSESVGDLQTGFMSETYTGGWTNTIQGMEFATDMLTFDDRNDYEYADVAILLSDGLTNEPAGFELLLDPVSANLRDASSLVFAVGIGMANITELIQITDDPNNVYMVDNFFALQAELPSLIAAIRTRMCDTILPPTQEPVTSSPSVVETCKCCCPPLPNPCSGGRVFGSNSGCGCGCSGNNY